MATGRVPTTANSPLTAKGDLFTYSTAPARLAVGNNGETIVADSSTSTGLRYQSLFGANKNKILNGDFLINQRNFTSTVNNGYCFDRWSKSTSGSTGTVSPQVFTPGAAPVAGYEGTNFLRLVTAGQSAASDSAQISQFIEDVRTFASQTITISFWAKANTGTPKVYVETYQIFGSGGSGAVIQTGTQITLSTSWARYSVTIAVPSISGKTIGTNSYLAVNFFTSAGSDLNSRTNSLGLQNFTFDLWGVQAEAGSVATAFQTATGTIQGELAACQRYYQRATGTASNTAYICSGVAISTTRAFLNYPAPVTFRSAPSITQSSGAVGNAVISNQNITTIVYYSSGSLQQITLDVNVGSGLTASGAFFLALPQNAYVELSAEL